MDGAEVADQLAVTLDGGGLAWVQGWVLAGAEGEVAQGAGVAQQGFHVGLHVEEVDAVAAVGPAFWQAAAGDNAGDHRLLLQVAELADEAQAAFEQAHAVLLAVQVVLQCLDQARPQGRAHGGHVAGDGVGQQQRLYARAEQFEQFRINEAVGDGFLVAAGNQQAAQGRQVTAGFRLALGGQAGLRVANRQVVVAVQAGQLFDQVHFQADVEAVAWDVDGPLPFFSFGSGQLKGVQQLLDLGWAHFHAEHLGDAFGAQGDRGHLRQVLFADGFDNRAGFAADDVQQQLGGALHGFASQLRVHAALVAVRGVGVQAVGTGFTGDGDRLEEGAFQEQIAGFFGVHTAVLATHDAGNGQGAGVVGDHQGVGAQGHFLAVEQDELLALFGHAYADAAVDFC